MPGLDTVLGGGLLASGLYLVEGVPGTGKTILASQIAFHRASRGESVLFVTLVAESHDKLLQHLRGFDFFDERAIADRIWVLSGLPALVRGGFDELLRLLATSLHERRPALLVLDGFAYVQDLSDSPAALARFVHELNALVGMLRATALVLAPFTGGPHRTEHGIVDGLVRVGRVGRYMRRAWELEVLKVRGGKHVTGKSLFTIDHRGLRVFPRLEAIVSEREPQPGVEGGRASTGIPSLDEATRGGLVRGSSTSLMGAPGTGKTLLGLTFLSEGAQRGEPSLYLGFYESPERLLAKAAGIGHPLAQLVRDGRLRLEWTSPLEQLADEIAWRVDEIVRREGTRRLFVDGLEGFVESAVYPERFSQFVTALSTLLRAQGVTTVLSEELPLFGEELDSRVLGVSAVVENVLLMRYFEHGGALRRLLVVLKSRDSEFDPGIRELHIASTGLRLGAPLTGLEQLMTGRPRPAPSHGDAPRTP